jgi:3-phosphoshikimate 1-carboxyvinyltransferase
MNGPGSPKIRTVAPAKRLRGKIRVPGDKSITHRGVLLGTLANGRSRIKGAGLGADTLASMAVVQALGATVHTTKDVLMVTGTGLHSLREPQDVLDCGNSGTTMRLTAGLLAGRQLNATLTGDASLRNRPMGRITLPLRDLGAKIDGREQGKFAPLTLGASRLHGTDLNIDVPSAQVKSAIVLAALRADSPTTIRQPSPSRDHTERMLRAQGADVTEEAGILRINPIDKLEALDVVVPGDISSAAFWIVAATIHRDAEITICDVGLNPLRIGVLEALQAMGAKIEIHMETIEPEPSGTVVAFSSDLKAVNAAGDLIPRLIDEIPALVLAATAANGSSQIADAGELRVKESNRIQTVTDALSALGLQITPMRDGFVIDGPQHVDGGEVEAAGDHRIAMLAAIAGLSGTNPVTIRGSDAVDVSYPNFWNDLERLRV